MKFTELLGRSLGLENVEAIDDVSLRFVAPWAERRAGWLVFGCALLFVIAVSLYLRYQPRGKRWVRVGLAVSRGILLSLMFLMMADPVIRFRLVSHPRPLLWMLFDGTESMAIEDELSSEEEGTIKTAVGLAGPNGASTAPAGKKLSRQEYVQAYLKRADKNLIDELNKRYRLKAYVFDQADGVRALEVPNAEKSEAEDLDAQKLAEMLSTKGQVTAVGKSLEDLSLRHASHHLAGVLMFSDFDQNAGPAPQAPAKRLGVPVYTVGVGPEAAVDLSVDLQAPLLMKKAERSTLTVLVRQTGLQGQSVLVKLSARKLTGSADNTVSLPQPVAEKQVNLDGPFVPVEFPYEPTDTGRFIFSAAVDALPAEVVPQNNQAERETNIRDDFLRLMFVEYEPTWEWRFIKEVFHRDQLVGMRGFRTYLRSADPKVRETNELFLPTLTPKRSEFFANDVIFLGDLPSSAISTRFCEMTKEFVSTFGGGLVVMAGPRFGPGQLAGTPLADMLPVIVDPDGRPQDQHEFRLQLAPESSQIDFMQLGKDESENLRAWNNIGALPWYQPVAKVHPLGTVLAQHPSDKTVDLKTPQPIIAIRRYGKGEVVYIAMNETWRLRRKYGEVYYRQFWGQMIHRLGLSHALGTQKRFVVRTDRQQYQADDKVTLTVEAYDANFEPLNEESFPQRVLAGELQRPGRADDGGANLQPISISQLRPGIFEARIPVYEGGEYRVKVIDPITKDPAEVFFQVTSLSAERRSSVRNVALQEQLAAGTGGKSYTLATVDQFVNDFHPTSKVETAERSIPVWHTWMCFSVIVLLMLGEWLVRKWINLP